MKKIIALLALSAFALVAQQTPTPAWETTASNGQPSVVMVPATLTAVVSVLSPQHVRVLQINLHNVTAAAVTVYILDGSTNCNGAACPVISSSGSAGLSVGANSTYTISLNGQPANGGVYWYASSANAVAGWMKGTK